MLYRKGAGVEGQDRMTTNPYESPVYESSLRQQAANWLGSAVRVAALVGLLGFLLLLVMPRWPIGGAREAARRAQCMNNMHNIAIALHQYESTYHCLPPAYTVDASGKPLHSWRTLILPFMEQQDLYKKIDLSKPWDDPANKFAFDSHPRLYECPSSTIERGFTTYFAVVAPGGCFQGSEPVPFAAVKDPRDQTLMVIEVAQKHAVHWMSPKDATEDVIATREANHDFAHPNGANAAFADGSVRFLNENLLADILRALNSIAGNDDDLASDHP
jgi:prepilin-type processing-associated H-X9-DG protein